MPPQGQESLAERMRRLEREERARQATTKRDAAPPASDSPPEGPSLLGRIRSALLAPRRPDEPMATGITDVGAAMVPEEPRRRPTRKPLNERAKEPQAAVAATRTTAESTALSQASRIMADEYGLAPPPEAAEQVVRATGRGLAHGTLTLGEDVGIAQQYAAALLNDPALREAGKKTASYWEQKAKRFELPEDLQGRLVDNPALMVHPEWLAYGVSDMLPGMGLGMLAGVGAAKYLTLAGETIAWTPEVIRRAAEVGKLAKIGGGLGGGVVGGALEGAQTFKEVLRLTGNEDLAARSAEMMTAAAGVLNALSFEKMLNPGEASALRQFLTSGATESLTEYLEEPSEGLIKLLTTGGKYTADDFREQVVAGLNVAPLAFISGGVGGVGGSMIQRAQKESSAEENQALYEYLKAEEAGDEAAMKAHAAVLARHGVTIEPLQAGPPKEAETEAKPGLVEGLRRRAADILDPGRKAELDEAYTDPMTGLANQTAFGRARQRIDEDPNLEWVSADVIGLKNTNDNISPAAGDELLKRIGGAVRAVAERTGIPVRNAMRPGGDEFGVAVPTGQGAQFGQALKEEVGEQPIGDTGLVTGIRYGVAQTWAEAAQAAQKAKELETEEKYRRGAKPQPAPAPATEEVIPPAVEPAAPPPPATGQAQRPPEAPYGVPRAPAPEGPPEVDIFGEPVPRSWVQPTGYAMLRPSDMRRDAARMQYKQDADATGVTAALKEVQQVDPDSIGTLLVWQDPQTDETIVADGHQRHALMQRLGYDQPVSVRFLNAATAEEARAQAALVNIRAGHGTPVDAAKLMRDMKLAGPALRDFLKNQNIPLRNSIAKSGAALANLAQSIFDQVATMKMPLARGIAIGESGLSAEQQIALLKMPGAEAMSVDELTELARDVKAAGLEAVQQETLFGTETFDVSLAPEKAKLASWIKTQLGKDKALLKPVADKAKAARLAELGVGEVDPEKAQALGENAAKVYEYFRALANRTGPVADALREGARRITKGEKRRVVQKETYQAVQAALLEALGGPVAPGAPGSGEAGAGGSAPGPVRESRGTYGTVPEGSDEVDVAGALRSLETAPSVRRGFEPDFASESRRHPQAGEPWSVQIAKSEGRTSRGEAMRSTDFLAYDDGGKLVGVLSIDGQGSFKITVRDDAQRRGWATRLLDEARIYGLDVAATVARNRFTPSGRRVLESWLRGRLARPVPEGSPLDDIMSSMAVTGEGMVGARMDRSLLKKLGANMYTRDPAWVVVKEAIQNAVDAVRHSPTKRVTVKIDPVRNRVVVQDTGSGMSPEVAANQFMDPGGSMKGEGSSGGYGLAKVGIFGAAEMVTMTTVAQVGDQHIETLIVGSADDWMGGTMRYATRRVSPAIPTGTHLSVELDPSLKIKWDEATGFLQSFLTFDRTGVEIDVFDREVQLVKGPDKDYNGTTTYPDTPTRVMKVAGAEIEVYESDQPARFESSSASVVVLNNGLYQFHESLYLGTNAKFPRRTVLNVRPTVDTEHNDYPFTTSREQLKGAAKQGIERAFVARSVTELAGRYGAIMDALRHPFRPTIGALAGDFSVYPATPNMDAGLGQGIADSRYAQELALAVRMVGRNVIELIRDGQPMAGDPVFDGLGLGKSYLAVNISMRAVREIYDRILVEAKTAGVDPAALLPSGQLPAENIILFNPFQLYREKDDRQLATPPELAKITWAAIIHEVAHQNARGHDEAFAGAHTRFEAEAAPYANEGLAILADAWTVALADPKFQQHLEEVETLWNQADYANIFKNVTGHGSTNLSVARHVGRGDAARGDDQGAGGPGEAAPGQGVRREEGVPARAEGRGEAGGPGADLGGAEARVGGPTEDELRARLFRNAALLRGMPDGAERSALLEEQKRLTDTLVDMGRARTTPRTQEGWRGAPAEGQAATGARSLDRAGATKRRIAAARRAIAQKKAKWEEQQGFLAEITPRPADILETPQERVSRFDERTTAALKRFEDAHLAAWREIMATLDALPADVREKIRLEWNASGMPADPIYLTDLVRERTKGMVREEGPGYGDTDLFGNPIERGFEQGELLPKPMQGVSEALAAAKAAISALEGKVQSGRARPTEVARYDAARSLLRRIQGEGLDAAEVAARRRSDPTPAPALDADVDDLFPGVGETRGTYGFGAYKWERVVGFGDAVGLEDQEIGDLVGIAMAFHGDRDAAMRTLLLSRPELARKMVQDGTILTFLDIVDGDMPSGVTVMEGGQRSINAVQVAKELGYNVSNLDEYWRLPLGARQRVRDIIRQRMGMKATPEATKEQLVFSFGSTTKAKKIASDLAKVAGPMLEISMPGVMPTAERIEAVKKARQAAFFWVPATGKSVGRGNSNWGGLNRTALFNILESFRSPEAEYFHILILAPAETGNGYVVHTHLLSSVGGLDRAEIPTTQMVQALAIAKKIGGQVVVAHNHPSGNANPSPEDIAATTYLATTAAHIQGFKPLPGERALFAGQVVINHNTASFIGADGAVTSSTFKRVRQKDEWTALTMKAPIQGQQDAINYLATTPAPSARRIDVLYIDTGHNVIAYEARSVDDIATMTEWLPQRIADTAASSAVIGTWDGESWQDASKQASIPGMGVLDVINVRDKRSARAAGVLWKATVATMPRGVGVVFEKEGLYGIPDDYFAGVTKKAAAEWAKDRVAAQMGLDPLPMEQLEAVLPDGTVMRPIDTPELVRMITDLIGKASINVQRLPGAWGMFRGDPKNPTVVLSPALGKDDEQFIHTLSHEFGHLIDFLPDRTLRRGNLLGRLATLRNYLKTTLDAVPTVPSRALTEADRKALDKQAYETVKANWPGGKAPKWDDKAAWKQWRLLQQAEYARLVEEEMNLRNLIGLERVKEEAHLVSFWWRPMPDPTSPSRYRLSSVELYADLLSVLLVSPGSLQAKAPTIFNTLIEYRKNKPDFWAEYDAIMQLVGSGSDAVLEARSKERRKGYEEFEQKIREREERLRTPAQRWGEYILQALSSRAAPATGREARRTGAPPWSEQNAVRMLYKEFLLRDNVNRSMMEDVIRLVHEPLLEAGLTPEDLGEFMELHRIAEGDRGGLAAHAKQAIMDITGEDTWGKAYQAYVTLGQEEAQRLLEDPDFEGIFSPRLLAAANQGLINPGGETAKTAQEGLDHLRRKLGQDKWDTMRKLDRVLRTILGRSVDRAAQLGVFSRDMYKNVLLPNRDTYVPFKVLAYFDGLITAGIKRQVGTTKYVGNAYVAAVMQALALNRLNEYQAFKLGILQVLDTDFPGSGPPRRLDRYHHLPIVRPGRGLLLYHNNGRLWYREVDDFVVKMLDKFDLGVVGRAARNLSSASYSVFHPLYVMTSIAWFAKNVAVRDPKRTFQVAMPVLHAHQPKYRQALEAILDAGRLIKAYAQTAWPAWQAARRRYNPLIRQMIDDRALGRALHSFEPFEGDGSVERIAETYGLIKPTHLGTKDIVQQAARPVEVPGVWSEVWAKAALYKLLQGEVGKVLTPRERANLVREYAGTPLSQDSGLAAEATNSVYFYVNVILAGWRANMEIGTNPKTAFGYWFRSFIMDYGIKAGMALALLGGLGEWLREWMNHVPDYDREKYIVFPVWPFYLQAPDGTKKAVYARIPHEDTNKLLAAVLWALAIEKGPHKVARASAAASGEFPGMNPVLDLTWDWGKLATGTNPINDFTGRSIVSNDEWEAGGWHRYAAMARYTAGEFGSVSRVGRMVLDITTEDTPAEKEKTAKYENLIRYMPVLNSLIRVSNGGVTQQSYVERDMESRDRARIRLEAGSAVTDLTKTRNVLQTRKDQLTDREKEKLADINAWYTDYYVPLVAEALQARQGGDRVGYEGAIADLAESVNQVGLDRPPRRPREAREPREARPPR